MTASSFRGEPAHAFRYRITMPNARLDTMIIESCDDLIRIRGGWAECTDGRLINLDAVLMIERLP